MTNHALPDDIRAYWADRSSSFDQSFAHAIAAGPEFDGWCAELARHLPAAPAQLLELGCGTGEISRVLRALGHRITGLDFCPQMLARARAKHAGDDAIRFHLNDAQNTMEADVSHDAIICRHLVWTLTDPHQAFQDWLRVLRPAGRVVILDGDWANSRGHAVWVRPLIAWLGRNQPADPVDDDMMDRHAAIMGQLPYGAGLTAARLTADLAQAGFVDIAVHSYRPLNRAMAAKAPLRHKLRLLLWQRFIVTARKP